MLALGGLERCVWAVQWQLAAAGVCACVCACVGVCVCVWRCRVAMACVCVSGGVAVHHRSSDARGSWPEARDPE